MIRAAANRLVAVEILQDIRSIAIVTTTRRSTGRFTVPMVAWFPSSSRQLNEAIEDGEFEFQFDAVREWLIQYLEVVKI